MNRDQNGFEKPSRRSLLLLLPALALTGCGGDAAPKTTGLRFILQADDEINPNANNEASPVVLRIYELKSLNAFSQATLFELLDNDTAVLGADMVGKREIEIKPGEKQAFERSTPVDTRYIGVIAGFRVIDQASWRASTQITPEKSGAVVVKVTAQAVTIAMTTDKTFGLF
jgi:type VI secretion system protein VasD